MTFQLTPTQLQVKQLVETFAHNEIAPIAAELDEKNRFPSEIVQRMGQLGLMKLPFSTDNHTGDMMSYAIAVEELSRVDAGVGVILSAHVSLASWPLAEFGTEQQQQQYLLPLINGEKIGAFALTEPNAGSDAGNTETTAVLNGDHYLLNGTKIFITNGGYADTYIVFAATKPQAGTHGISAFIVEKGWEGFQFGVQYNKMGIRSSATAELVFKNVKIPRENLLGQENQGFKIAMQTLEGGRIGIAAQALGIAQGSHDKAIAYAKDRIQFGKPIAAQQSVAFKLADMATKIRAARLLVYSAAALKQQHQPYGVESAMAKLYASDICLEVVNEAVQIHGGYGYIKGFEVERMYRDAKICTIYEGTNEIQKLIISQAILGKLSTPSTANTSNKAAVAPNHSRRRIILNTGTTAEKVMTFTGYLCQEGLLDAVIMPQDLATADKVCSIGRGLVKQEDLILIDNLAKTLGAAIGCSRPVAEEQQWLPLSSFFGLSGQKFNGSFYLAIGISGQSQHLSGIRNSRIIAAINNDIAAPIFEHVDYGLVGDLYEIIPLLTKSIKKVIAHN